MKHTINVITEIMILPYEVRCAVTFSPICVLVDFELRLPGAETMFDYIPHSSHSTKTPSIDCHCLFDPK